MTNKMNWKNLLPEKLLAQAEHLTLEKVLVDREATKLLICFLSDTLARENEYLALRKALQRSFPGLRVSLRVCSPHLSGAVRENLSEFVPFLTGCLARTSPGVKPWLEDAKWSLEKERLIVSLASEEGLRYARHVGLDARLKELMLDVFRMEIEAALVCEEDMKLQRERLKMIDQLADEAAERYRQEMRAEEAAKKDRPVKLQILGTAIKDAVSEIASLREDSGRVAVRGEVISVDTRELKGGEMRLLSFLLTDYTSTITCKTFLRYKRRRPGAEEGNGAAPTEVEIARVDGIVERIQPGGWLTVRGDCQHDRFAREQVIMLTDIQRADAPVRKDTAPEKRVELHLHTQMSSMDGVSSATALIEQAARWGHPAVAITDHGVVQAFPEAFAAAKAHKIKLIPGMEGYLATDEADIVKDADARALDSPVVVLDFETTGLSPRHDRVIEVGAVRVRGGEILGELSVLLDPGMPIPAASTKVHGITTAMVRGAPSFADVAGELLEFIGDAALVAHNAPFDMGFLREELTRCGKSWKGPVVDTLIFSRKALPTLRSHKLGALCRHFGIKLTNAHRAVHDAVATAHVLSGLLEMAREKGVSTYRELNQGFTGGLRGESSHIILLAASQQGMTNLNRIVSEAHLNHFFRRPSIPRALLQQYREGIIVGSACEAGELFHAVLMGQDDRALSQIARFYDYLEIQPVDNNAFLVREGHVRDVEELRAINRKIVALGEKHGLPVVATGDVHFLNPRDAVYRAILMAGKGFDNPDDQPPLYFKTTDEMLEEFSYLGAEKAHEVVITNPNKIAERVGAVRLFPEHPDGLETFQPLWESAADDIETMAVREAKRLYGEALPEIVRARLDKELRSIIGYGFATLYSIARKLVQKSMADGYLVGSRGSVGSSFVATMCGITEVNPLPPHYLCPDCHYVQFDERHELASMGIDLPEKACPECGAALRREGYDIPFEVFLGFKGDKVPDIDLNFSGVYQPVAHKYVEELFGEGNVFRAGTIGTLADRTAYGYVNGYLKERERVVTEAEKNRLVLGCVGVKRTTGQHPGGIVVLPKGYEIYQFTAIQHPADDTDSPVVTTHYDFASMHDVLVKLDILGHDDPTMLNMLERLTGASARELPITDPKVMSLFTGPEALSVSATDIRCSTGTLGIPEFGTRFVRGMLDKTQPKTMNELVRISGLSHGTDVWLGNAEALIASGTATLENCICARDDIMNYLMLRGMEPLMAFQTMESVRKGKGLTAAMESAMRAVDTPEWFIDSCKKIKYMFPRSHAVAYVTMALRVAWYKVYHKEAYYAAYFSVRADAFDITLMSRSAAELREALDDYELRYKELTAAERDQLILCEIALEMAMRGVKLLPVDLYESSADAFELVDGAILPPFLSVPGLGLSAAESLCEARKAGPFMSVEDVKLRAKVSVAVIDQLRANGVLKGLSETSQVSLF